MLILSRKSRESVVVGAADGVHRLVRVTVLDIQGGNVKLGFEADSDVPVHRSEVWDRINAAASGRLTRDAAAACMSFPEPAQATGLRKHRGTDGGNRKFSAADD
jgi:carbon storage regulator